jgi:CheY-like chemotaxis protein
MGAIMDAANAPPSFDAADVKTLIVSDNAFDRRLVHDLLIALGVKEILQADDAVAAIAQMMLRRPRLIIADAEMRPLSGLGLAREIRASASANRNIPLVLYTSETSPDFAALARDAGAHEVIAKPVSADALRACLAEAMTRPRDFSELANKPKRRLAMPTDAAPAKSTQLARAVRSEILALIDEARGKVARWAATGDTALVEAARNAIQRANDHAWSGGADRAVTGALAGALRLAEAGLLGRADPHLLDVTLAAARAVLAADPTRRAMREALAEAVNDAAEARSTGS